MLIVSLVDAQIPSLITETQVQSELETEELNKRLAENNILKDSKKAVSDITDELKVLEQEIKPYMYFIESEDWILVSENKDKLNILVPSFKSDNSIVWRWRI